MRTANDETSAASLLPFSDGGYYFTDSPAASAVAPPLALSLTSQRRRGGPIHLPIWLQGYIPTASLIISTPSDSSEENGRQINGPFPHSCHVMGRAMNVSTSLVVWPPLPSPKASSSSSEGATQFSRGRVSLGSGVVPTTSSVRAQSVTHRRRRRRRSTDRTVSQFEARGRPSHICPDRAWRRDQR